MGQTSPAFKHSPTDTLIDQWHHMEAYHMCGCEKGDGELWRALRLIALK